MIKVKVKKDFKNNNKRKIEDEDLETGVFFLSKKKEVTGRKLRIT